MLFLKHQQHGRHKHAYTFFQVEKPCDRISVRRFHRIDSYIQMNLQLNQGVYLYTRSNTGKIKGAPEYFSFHFSVQVIVKACQIISLVIVFFTLE